MAVFATVKLNSGFFDYGQEIQPIINILQIMTKNGPAWLVDYAYDPVQQNGSNGYDYDFQHISADGTFSVGTKTIVISFSPQFADQYSYYVSLLNTPPYAHLKDLIQQWYDTGIMPLELQKLILMG